MSPEQMVASPQVDWRADIWSLGVILYELLSGKPPFAAASFLELGLEVTNRAHPSLARRVPGLAAGLVAVVDRCLQKSPASRFPDLAGLAAALVPHAGSGAELSAGRVARTLGVRGQTTGESTAVLIWRGRRRRLLITGLIAGGLAATVGAAAIWHRQRAMVDPERAPASAEPPRTTPAAAALRDSPVSPPKTEPAAPVPAPPPAAPLQESGQNAGAAGPRHHRRASDGASSGPRAGSAAAPASAGTTPPPERPAPEERATRTRRGPVVTDL
jgi:serine/threonine-protein kinase